MNATDKLTDALSRLHDLEQKLRDGITYYAPDRETLGRWAARELPTLHRDVIPNIALLIREAIAEVVRPRDWWLRRCRACRAAFVRVGRDDPGWLCPDCEDPPPHRRAEEGRGKSQARSAAHEGGGRRERR